MSAISRVAQLVRKTLSFYRADVNPAATRITDLVEEVVWLYQKRMRTAGIHLEKRFDFSDEIVCNAGEIRQVLTNIFGNAGDAASSGGNVVVRVASARSWVNGRGRGVRVVIADTGSGIPTLQRANLFTPFFSSKGYRDTGLGLWISKGIMEKNGGHIRFRSRTSQPSGTVGALRRKCRQY